MFQGSLRAGTVIKLPLIILLHTSIKRTVTTVATPSETLSHPAARCRKQPPKRCAPSRTHRHTLLLGSFLPHCHIFCVSVIAIFFIFSPPDKLFELQHLFHLFLSSVLHLKPSTFCHCLHAQPLYRAYRSQLPRSAWWSTQASSVRRLRPVL